MHMGVLSLALYCEGNTDKRFLPPIIQKTSRYILYTHSRVDVEVMQIQIMMREDREQHGAIFAAARQARGYDILIVHADADGPTAQEAHSQRFEPGYKQVLESQEEICRDLIPIIPIQAIEAWMMADYQLLLDEIGTDLRPTELNIPTRANQVETISRPKQRLKQAVHIAYAHRTRRQRATDIDFLYEPIGEKISLERLRMVTSYNQFVSDLTTTLKSLNFIN